MVGALVVQGSEIVGEGYHTRAGSPHAEVEALEAARSRTAGGTLYVTLEPCVHTGRTPPCVEAIRDAGIRRVVIATEDPNPVARGGAERLRDAGLTVDVGVLHDEAWRLNDVYHVLHERGRPFVALKVATTLDGRIAAPTGEARWITSLAARREAHRLRARYDAVLVGIGTVLADDPHLTVRHVRGRQPVRVVLDSRLRIPLEARVLEGHVPLLIATTEAAPEERTAALTSAGHEVVVVPTDALGRVDVAALLWTLGRRGVRSVLVEGGKDVYTAFLRAGLVDRVYCFVAPRILGGRSLGWTGDLEIASIEASLRLMAVRTRRLGPDVLVDGYLATSVSEETRAAQTSSAETT
jgi:diaminohydroxyphosphoribosylaminopyrimidine deaminase/5-amino-6-(5-phosphoribosylamino)uracil reductase